MLFLIYATTAFTLKKKHCIKHFSCENFKKARIEVPQHYIVVVIFTVQHIIHT